MGKSIEIVFYSLVGIIAFWTVGRLYYVQAVKRKILDIPSHRSSHSIPTVRGGGILFFLSVAVGYSAYIYPQYLWFFAGFLLLSAIGWLDDRKNLSARVRFPVQLAAILMILYDAGLFTADFHWAVKVLGVIVALGFVNAFNFMDGINGITGLYSLVLLGSLFALNHYAEITDKRWLWIVALSIMAFGYFNFRKQAMIFSGDTGTMALAAFFLFHLAKAMIDLQAPVLLLLVLVYGTDSAMTIIRRLLHRENIFLAHRWHLYQRMVDRWHWPHLAVAGFYALLQAVINVFVLRTFINKPELFIQFGMLSGVLIIFALFYLIIQNHYEPSGG